MFTFAACCEIKFLIFRFQSNLAFSQVIVDSLGKLIIFMICAGDIFVVDFLETS